MKVDHGLHMIFILQAKGQNEGNNNGINARFDFNAL